MRSTADTEKFAFGPWRLDVSERTLLRDGQPVSLTPRVFDTLVYFVRNHGRLLGKEELMRAIWPDTSVEENNLSQNVSTLRRVLGSVALDQVYIETVPSHGYRFRAEVRLAGADSDTATAPAPGRRFRGRIQIAGFVTLMVVAGALFWLIVQPRFAPPPGAAMRSIAVLPFKPLVPAHTDQVLELGMADTLIARLSSLRDVTVCPLNAVRKYNGVEQDARVAGRDLAVDAVLDGTIHRNGNLIRVTARLLRVSDGRQLWEGRFDAKLTDLFEVQNSISEKVAGELASQLTPAQHARLLRQPTDDVQAYELYLRGRFFTSLAQPAEAVRAFEEAVRRDPEFALAHAGLADINSRLPVAADAPPRELIPKARASALRALTIDDHLGEAHASLGWIHFYYDWNWAASEASFRRALEINPSDFSARLGYAHLLSNIGRHTEALGSIREAQRLDPFSPLAQVFEATFLVNAGRVPEAARQAARTLERNPSFWIAQIQVGRIHERQGDYEAALRSYETAGRVSVSRMPLVLTAHALAASGRREEALRKLAELRALEARMYVPATYVARVYAGLRDREEALRWLEKAMADRDVHMVFLGVDPYWDELRGENRFIALMNRMNFPAFSAPVRPPRAN